MKKVQAYEALDGSLYSDHTVATTHSFRIVVQRIRARKTDADAIRWIIDNRQAVRDLLEELEKDSPDLTAYYELEPSSNNG